VKDYYRFHLLSHFASNLSNAIDKEDFDFYAKQLYERTRRATPTLETSY
jgi:predicted metalloendopeptidase